MNEAIGTAVLERIAELWRRREWYRSHLGWIVQSKIEDDRELRALVRLARQARRQAEADTVWRVGARPGAGWNESARARIAGWTEPELREAWGR